MNSSARTLYLQRHGRDPFGAVNFYSPARQRLQQMVDVGRILAIDLTLAHHIASIHGTVDDEAGLAALCHLHYCSREGHLAVSWNGTSLYPDPADSWLSPDVKSNGISPESLAELCLQVKKGISAWMGLAQNNNIFQLHAHQNLLYLQRHWVHESRVVDEVQRLCNSSPKTTIDLDRVEKRLQELLSSGKLLPEQADAVRCAAQKNLTILTGGPGTGKTYTATYLLQVLQEASKSPLTIALAAPTGKAAAHLLKSLSASSAQVCSSQTLHALLWRIKKEFGEKGVFGEELILVDEASMIDVKMMGELLSSVGKGCRLILLGDSAQLPPVESGGVFADIAGALKGSGHVVELKRCMRSELDELIVFSEAVKVGDADSSEALLKDRQGKDGVLSFFSLDRGTQSTQTLKQKLVHYLLRTFAWPGRGSKDFLECFEAYEKFRLLTPMREGPFGVEELNRELFKELLRVNEREEFFYAPILIVKNSYEQQLFNGETGLVRYVRGRHGGWVEGDAYFPNYSQEGGLRAIPSSLLPPHEWAFCLSVHKSQGSEFPHVGLILMEGAERFGREMVYTAMTRAKRRLDIIGSMKLLRAAIAVSGNRVSGVRNRIMNNTAKRLSCSEAAADASRRCRDTSDSECEKPTVKASKIM